MSGVERIIEQIIEAAQNSPQCFKCREPISEFSEVRIVTVRIDDKPVSVWVHAAHAQPDPPSVGCLRCGCSVRFVGGGYRCTCGWSASNE